jgi:hypothetical protein
MVFDRTILEALEIQIGKDEIVELRELSAVARILNTFIDYLHGPVKSSVRSPKYSDANNVRNSAEGTVDKMISLVNDAEKHAADLEGRANKVAKIIKSKRPVLPQEVTVAVNDFRMSDAIKKEMENIKKALETLKGFLQEMYEKRQLDPYYDKAESIAHKIVDAVGDVTARIKYLIYGERLLEQMEGLPK